MHHFFLKVMVIAPPTQGRQIFAWKERKMNWHVDVCASKSAARSIMFITRNECVGRAVVQFAHENKTEILWNGKGGIHFFAVEKTVDWDVAKKVRYVFKPKDELCWEALWWANDPLENHAWRYVMGFFSDARDGEYVMALYDNEMKTIDCCGMPEGVLVGLGLRGCC
jgi:hypothetical protein